MAKKIAGADRPFVFFLRKALPFRRGIFGEEKNIGARPNILHYHINSG